MTSAPTDLAEQRAPRGWVHAVMLLFADPLAAASAVFLLLLVIAAVIGPELFHQSLLTTNLRLRNLPPFSSNLGIAYFLGADSLGRPMLPRLLVASRTTLLIATSTVACSSIIGAVLGMIAGYYGGRIGSLIMRASDVVMSFPSLLLAMLVLYLLEPRVGNVVIVLAITRIPVYVRVARAEVLEIRERLFIDAARAAGASDFRILSRHIAAITLPTMLTVATLDFATVMLAESALSFLGIGVQPPGVTWGAMVATGQSYLSTAWWLAFWPGLAILLTALAANLLSNWLRVAMDPRLRWRLQAEAASSVDD